MQLPYTRLVRKLEWWARPAKRLAIVKRLGQPVSRQFGFDRGHAIDRHWIESFLARHASIRAGDSLEVGETAYVRRHFPRMQPHRLEPVGDGAPDCVEYDLAEPVPRWDGRFDVFVATQVYNFMFEPAAGIANSARLLKTGGELIGSVGAISQISRYDADRWGHYWSFTPQSITRLLARHFATVEVEAFGNVDTACAFLNGLAVEEIDPALLAQHDPDYPVVICFRAVKG